MSKPELYGTAEAAEYLGMHVQTLKYHIYDMHHIAADYEVGGNLLFLQSTLDAFKAAYQAEGLTTREAAEYLGVEYIWLRRRIHKQVQPDGKRGNQWVFTKQNLDSIRESLLNK